MPAVNPDHLLEQALYLARTSAGAPRTTDLRRAISNCYYAVFHEAASSATDNFIGSSKKSTFQYRLAYRSIDHFALRELCEDIVKPTLPAKYLGYAPAGGFGSDIQAFANALTELQEKRHKADYDPHFDVYRSDARLAIVTAADAMGRLRSADRIKRKAFFSLVLFKPKR